MGDVCVDKLFCLWDIFSWFLQIQIDLSNLDPEKGSLAWYALQEPNTSAAGLVKIKYGSHEESHEEAAHF